MRQHNGGALEWRRARAFIGTDGKALYLALETELPEDRSLVTGKQRKGVQACFEDIAEFFIDPDPDAASGINYHLLVNAAGNTDFDALPRGKAEKPDWSRVVTDLVNTGIYVISPRIMELVPEGREFDFAKDLFPLLLQRGELMLGLPMEGYWCDVGTPLSYYRCCADALEGRLKLSTAADFVPGPDQAQDSPPPSGAESLDCACRSRAELMGLLSELLLDMGADYSDGLQLDGPRFHLRISPLASRSALRISVASQDAEFARELALSARDLARALDAGSGQDAAFSP